MNKKIFTKILILLVMVIVVNVNVEGASINEAMFMVGTYHELASKGEWLEQSNLIIKDELDGFKDKLVSIPKLETLEKLTSNELYAHIFSSIMSKVRIDKSEIIDTVQESEELIYVVVRDTISSQNGKKSSARMLTLKYINNEWKISDAERLSRTADIIHLQLLKSTMQKLETKMLALEKLKMQISKMRKSGIQKPEVQNQKMQEPEIQESVTQKPEMQELKIKETEIEGPETQK